MAEDGGKRGGFNGRFGGDTEATADFFSACVAVWQPKTKEGCASCSSVCGGSCGTQRARDRVESTWLQAPLLRTPTGTALCGLTNPTVRADNQTRAS